MGIPAQKPSLTSIALGKRKLSFGSSKPEEGIIGGQSDLALYVSGFYAKLYTSDATAPGTREAQEECWKSVPVKVSPIMNERLIQDLSLKDITKAIRALSKGRALGHDGIPMEFFQEFEAEIAPSRLLGNAQNGSYFALHQQRDHHPYSQIRGQGQAQ